MEMKLFWEEEKIESRRGGRKVNFFKRKTVFIKIVPGQVTHFIILVFGVETFR